MTYQQYSAYGLSITATLLLMSLGEPVSAFLLVALILIAGLPHGLLDPWIYDVGISGKTSKLKRFLLIYISMAAAVWLLWLTHAATAFILFLVLSSWHFGQDIFAGKKIWVNLQALFYGASVIAWPFIFHTEESLSIVSYMGVDFSVGIIKPVAVIVVAINALALCLNPASQSDRLEWPMLAIISGCLDPLAYFTIYFCCLHSWRHYHQHARLWQQLLNNKPLSLLILWCISVLAFVLIMFVFWFFYTNLEAAMITTVFGLLAALTVPHMWVIWRSSDL